MDPAGRRIRLADVERLAHGEPANRHGDLDVHGASHGIARADQAEKRKDTHAADDHDIEVPSGAYESGERAVVGVAPEIKAGAEESPACSDAAEVGIVVTTELQRHREALRSRGGHHGLEK